ncbi:YjzC family protein [Planctomicrobium sp. SH661]|uniref:YjzC family protein n=1 Tax=Planctomicrobium sp. SH661 TaxID=3448124 RepID=UPI003F5B12EC
MPKHNGLKPGQSAPASGQYQERGPRGGKGREVTVPRGHNLPPTTQSGSTYNLVDRTKNEAGKK